MNYRIVSLTGETKWVLEQGLGIFSKSDEVVALEGFIEDISQRKIAEIALMERLKNYWLIYESDFLGIGYWGDSFISIKPTMHT